MYSQFERQFTDFLRIHLAHLDLKENRANEDEVLQHITQHISSCTEPHITKCITENKLNSAEEEEHDQKSGYTNHPDEPFKVTLVKSLKSEELAQAHVCFAEELIRSNEHKLALNELCEAIKNCTTMETFCRIIATRILALSRMNKVYERQLDIQLLSSVCCKECTKAMFSAAPVTDKAGEYRVFTDKFGPILACKLDQTTRTQVRIIANKTEQNQKCNSPHNEIRSCTVPSMGEHLSGEYSCVSKCVEIKESNEKGRHVVSRSPLQIGDIIAAEGAACWTVLPDKWSSHCQHCLNVCAAPLPCGDCPDVVYCSVKCLEQDELHRVECGYMAALQTLPKMVYLAFRTVIMFKKDIIRHSRNEETSIEFKNIYSLITNLEGRTPVDVTRRATLSIFLTKIIKELAVFKMCFGSTICGGSNISIGDITLCMGGCHQSMDYKSIYSTTRWFLLKCLQSYPCNAHEISELQIRPDFRYSANEDIGAGVFPFLSLVNHSCNPNVVRHSVGKTTVLRVLRDMAPGEELLDNYGYHYATHSATERRKALRSQYLFECRCAPCVEGGDRWKLFSQLTTTIRFRCFKCGAKFSEVRKKCNECGQNVSKSLQRISLLESRVKCIISKFVLGKDLNMDIAPVVEFLSTCERHTCPPFRLFNECQEVVKQKWNLASNKRRL